MFKELSAELIQHMQQLEIQDQRDRTDGTPRNQRLRQITPDTGKFLAIIASSLPEGEIIEIGTSAGYSTIWLALAARDSGRRVKTFEIDEHKIKMASDTFGISGLSDHIELIHDDFLQRADALGPVAFCFLDAEKDVYETCFKAIADKMVKGGLIVADNAIDQYEGIKPMIESALTDDRFDCITVPIGNGEFICRRK